MTFLRRGTFVNGKEMDDDEVVLFCDGPGPDGKGYCDKSIAPIPVERSSTNYARRAARARNWYHNTGRDLCPEHYQTVLVTLDLLSCYASGVWEKGYLDRRVALLVAEGKQEPARYTVDDTYIEVPGPVELVLEASLGAARPPLTVMAALLVSTDSEVEVDLSDGFLNYWDLKQHLLKISDQFKAAAELCKPAVPLTYTLEDEVQS